MDRVYCMLVSIILHTTSYYRSIFTHIPKLVRITASCGAICSSMPTSLANPETKEAEFGAQHADNKDKT